MNDLPEDFKKQLHHLGGTEESIMGKPSLAPASGSGGWSLSMSRAGWRGHTMVAEDKLKVVLAVAKAIEEGCDAIVLTRR